MPIRLATRSTRSTRRDPQVWPLNRPVVPPALSSAQQAEVKAVVQGTPAAVGIDMANWNWKAVCLFVEQRFGQRLCRSSCHNYLHRLGFVPKRHKKRLVKADPVKRDAFVADYTAVRVELQVNGAKIFFVDEAHFRADVALRTKWVLGGEPALVDSTSPRLGEKATYYSGVCLETGEVEFRTVSETCTAATSVDFLQQLLGNHSEPLVVMRDNSPAHRGPEMREYLATPDLKLRLVALPSCSPDLNAGEMIWDWAREEAMANVCFGTAAKARERLDPFFAGLAERTAEVQQPCRTMLQARADELISTTNEVFAQPNDVDFTLVSV
jgi:transposase